MQESRGQAPRRPARQLCLICTIVEDLAAQAERDLLAGKLDAVGEALERIQAQISGVRADVPVEVTTAQEAL